jgi:hypothetical protein
VLPSSQDCGPVGPSDWAPTPGRKRVENAKLLRHFQRRMMRQHVARAADAHDGRDRGKRAKEHLGSGACHAVAVVMFGDPIAMVAELLAGARKRQGVADGGIRGLPRGDA